MIRSLVPISFITTYPDIAYIMNTKTCIMLINNDLVKDYQGYNITLYYHNLRLTIFLAKTCTVTDVSIIRTESF